MGRDQLLELLSLVLALLIGIGYILFLVYFFLWAYG